MLKNKKIIIMFILLLIIMIPTIVKANNDVVVLLDPGHGGYDSGATYGSLYEKDVTWKITQKVKDLLDKEKGITSILSRNEDECPEIKDRGEKAKEIGADLVVSFHINSSTSSLPRGSEVYVTRNTRLDRFFKKSNELAIDILNNLNAIGIPKNGSHFAKLRGTESGNIYPDGTYADYYGIIRYPMNYGIPSVLIEHCFISNAYDRNFINNDTQIEKIVQADANAIIKHKDSFKIDKNNNAVKGALDSIYYDNNTGSVKGKVLYNEVINDMAADAIPKVRLVSEDGKDIIEGKVEKVASYTYSYDINILNINLLKRYNLQVETMGKASFPKNSSLILSLPDKELGSIYSEKIQIKNGLMFFGTEQYNGYMTSYEYGELKVEGNNIEGNLIVQEWINGTVQARPRVNPIIVLKGQDGTEIQCNVSYVEPYVYKFSVDLEKINRTQFYNIEVRCGSANNISNHTTVQVEFSKNQNVGTIGDCEIYLTNSLLNFTYDGYMTNSPYSSITLNGNIITGKIVIQEWLDGTKQIQPTSLPKIVLKTTNGIEVVGLLKYIEPYVYEYQFDLTNVDKELIYEMEVQCTHPNNISTHKDVVVQYTNIDMGTIQNYIMRYLNNKIIFEKIDNSYDGYMTNAPYSSITLNGNIMTGKLVIQEWLNGTKQIEPTSLPKIVLKSSNGAELTGTLRYVQPYVYEYQFDLRNIDKTLKYEMEVQCTNPDNISKHKDVIVQYSDAVIGEIDNYKMKYVSSQIIFEEINNNYNGYMTNSPYSEITLNGNIMTARLVIQEWLNGTKQIRPTSLPKIVLKYSNGMEILGALTNIEPYVYEYKFDVSSLSQDIEYEMEVQCTNPNNISTHKDVVVNYENTIIGMIQNSILKIQNNKFILINE